jgi:hypothetical protein
MEDAGLKLTGRSPNGVLPEIVERDDHPWFIGVQYHPELKSRPFAPHPLFASFIGGLLSAHLACGDPVLLAKAKDLADRLAKAFEASPHGLPWRYVNLRTGAVSDPETNLAEIGTYLSEFGVLSQLTGDASISTWPSGPCATPWTAARRSA